MPRLIPFALIGALTVCGCTGGGPNGSLTNDPDVPRSPSQSPEPTAAGEPYQVRFETSEGDFVVQVHPEWAPRGAARFRELVEAGFYDECRFFRVIDGFMAQVGINGDPAVNDQWRQRVIRDDPVKVSNERGRVTFATSGPDSRTTQIFFNYGDNSGLDRQGFAPFGEVISGMEVVDSLYGGYGEGAPHGRGPDQQLIGFRGNEYLNDRFPRLSYIKSARIVDDVEQGATAPPGARPAGEQTNAGPSAGQSPTATKAQQQVQPGDTVDNES